MEGEKRKILIVDDDNFLLDMYALKFSQNNFEVYTAGSGTQALEKIAPTAEIADVRPTITELRMVKTSGEIALLQKATDTSIAAHRASWKRAKPGLYEYQVAASMLGVMFDHGCERPAYSPIVGAGQYTDNDVGAAGSTGRGEANIKVCGAFLTVEQMRRGMAPSDACLETLKRVMKMTEPRLLRPDGRPTFGLIFYAVNKRGDVGAASLYPNRCAVHDGRTGELRDTAYLYEKPK